MNGSIQNFVHQNERIYSILKLCQKFTRTVYWLPKFIAAQIRKTFRRDVILCECSVRLRHYSFLPTNWGDDINKYLFEYLTNQKICFLPYDQLLFRNTHFLLIGSILSFYSLDGAIIYGSGLISPEEEIRGIPQKVISVRGPLTRAALISKGIDCPAHYGDPALFAALVLSVASERKEWSCSD